MKTQPYERWIWIELIGFDHQAPDFGVADYLENAGFVPEAVSLLLFTPDFLHGHGGMEREWELPMEACSYAARPYGKERNRQPWTNWQLRGLVEQLRSHGIAVYCSFFNLFLYRDNGKQAASRWCSAHPELYEMRGSGEPFPVINPLKRLEDGTLYEDLFVADLARVMADYGFDGLHGGDGYTSPRLSLADADYSDDMVGQFLAESGVALDPGLEPNCDGDAAAMQRRADWIWKRQRMAWIGFYARRWAGFWRKTMAELRRMGKTGYLNTAWTREPFEALYRYGVDYRLLAEAGIDGFIVESGAAGLSAGADGIEYEPSTEFMATLLALKAYVPDTKLICLNGIQDTTEQWDVLSHAPTLIERDIYTLANVYLHEPDGLRRCADGFLACLGDGIEARNWAWINGRWQSAFAGVPRQVAGATFVWSDAALYPSLAQYSDNRQWPAHKFLQSLIEQGASMGAIARSEQLEGITGNICIADLHLWPDEQLDQALSYTAGGALLIAKLDDRMQSALSRHGMEMEGRRNEWFAIVREAGGRIVKAISGGLAAELAGDETDDKLSWIQPLAYAPLPADFVGDCVQALVKLANAPAVTRFAETAPLAGFQLDNGHYRLFIRNLNTKYRAVQVEAAQPIGKLEVVTDFPGVPLFPEGNRFTTQVPGRGITVIDLFTNP
jgi:hypothetical protein